MNNAFVFEAEPFHNQAIAGHHSGGHSCSCNKECCRTTRAGSMEHEVYQPAGTDVLEQFSGPEHRLIGDLGVGKIPTTIVYDEKGTTLTFGEVIALAGDLLEDYFQMKELARTAAGRGQIRWALWYATNGTKATEPRVPESIKEKVKEEYLALAGRNISHFSAGGTAWATYFKWHSRAMVHALDSGMGSSEKLWREALSKEAFALHFLTDSFSSGHVRTPRKEMDEWYAKNYSHALKRFVDRFASFMYSELKKRNRELRYPGAIPVIQYLPKYLTEREVRAGMGKEMKKFSLDDPVALAVHDIDNENGLAVVSDLDPSGRPVQGGYRWIAFGDDKLGELSPKSKRPETQLMIVSAVKASLKELSIVRAAGGKYKGRQLSQPQRLELMKKALGIKTGLWNKAAAAGYLPREDKTQSSKPLEWRWGKLDIAVYRRVDRDVKKRLADAFFEKAAKERARGSKGRIGGVDQALDAFANLLKGKGIKFLEELVGPAR